LIQLSVSYSDSRSGSVGSARSNKSTRGSKFHDGMRLEDFRIMKGDDGLEFIEFAEGPTKTRPGGLNVKPRQF